MIKHPKMEDLNNYLQLKRKKKQKRIKVEEKPLSSLKKASSNKQTRRRKEKKPTLQLYHLTTPFNQTQFLKYFSVHSHLDSGLELASLPVPHQSWFAVEFTKYEQ